jgi:hypothetical protein
VSLESRPYGKRKPALHSTPIGQSASLAISGTEVPGLILLKNVIYQLLIFDMIGTRAIHPSLSSTGHIRMSG